MTKDEVQSIFTLAGFEVLAMKELIDGYGYRSGDPRFYSTLPEKVWWFVKTRFGWIEIGWRRRVISINWSDTAINGIVTEDDVTKNPNSVHAGNAAKAVEYLAQLKKMGETQK